MADTSLAPPRPQVADESEPAVDVTDVGCRFGEKTALACVSMQVRPGEIQAVLGPNGAGKTTLFRTLVGLQAPTSGTVAVHHRTPSITDRQFCRDVRFLPSGNRRFYQRLTGLENLMFFARLQGAPLRDARAQAWAAVASVGLESAAKTRVGLYSHGMQKRLAVARALLGRPSVLVIDEATHDVDPAGTRRILELVAERADAGAAVLWATQRLDEIRGFAHRVSVLHRGAVRFDGTVPELVASVATQRYLVRLDGDNTGQLPCLDDLRAAIRHLGTVDPTADAEHFFLGLHDRAVLGDGLAAMASAGARVLSCSEQDSLVEAALLQLTEDDTGDDGR